MPILGLLILLLDIYTIYKIFTTPGNEEKRLLWTILVILLPLIGPILYFTIGK